MTRGFALWVVLGLLVATQKTGAGVYEAATTDSSPEPVGAAYLGLHIHHLLPRKNAPNQAVTAWPDVTFGNLRLWDSYVRWADIQPTSDTWDFGRLDAYVDAATQRGVKVHYVLGSTPAWASARPVEPCPYGLGCSAEPRDLADWDRYVREVSRRYSGRIHTYEIWNEPKFSDIAADRGQKAFYTGDVKTLVELTRRAKRILKETSPGAKVFSPGFVNGPERLAMYLKAGGRDYIDGVAYHFYSSDARRFVEQVREVKAVMQTHGVSGLPLWNTETGLESWPEHAPLPSGAVYRSPDMIAGHLAQFMVLGAASGIRAFLYHGWNGRQSMMFDPEGRPVPAHGVMKHWTSMMIGRRFKGCIEHPGWIACHGERENTPFLLAWSDNGRVAKLNAPAGHDIGLVRRMDGGLTRSEIQDGSSLQTTLDVMPVLVEFVRSLPELGEGG